MRTSFIENPRLKRELRKAFRENVQWGVDTDIPGDRFNSAVMAEIRKITNTRNKKERFEWIPNTAWRLAPVACGILFVLTVIFIRHDPSLEYDIAALLLTDPAGFHETNLFAF